jgi:hypothetical protein
MSDTLEMPLDTVKEWLDKETNPIIEPLKADAKKQLEDTKSKLGDLLEASNKLLDDAEKEMAKGSRKTYRRAKALQKLAEKFANLLEEVVFPEEISGKTLHQSSEQIEKTLKIIDKERMKWFRAIAPYFIMSRRRFDVMLKRASDSFQNFTAFLSNEYNKAETAEGISSKVEELRQSLTEFDRYEKAKETRKQKKELLEKKIEKSHQTMQAIQSKDEVIEFTQLNKRIEELSNAVKQELRHIQKPLLKFQSLVNSPGYSLLPEATAKLDDYLINPFDALATEKEGYPLLRSILQKIDIALDNNKLKLKPSRTRKAKDQINSLLNKAALPSLQKDCSEALNKKNELATSGTISESRDERAELQDQLKELQTRKNLLEARDARFEKQHIEARTRFEKQKKELEKLVSDLSGKNVQILTD